MKAKDKKLILGLSKKQLKEFAKLNFNSGYDKGWKDGINRLLEHNINLMKVQKLK